MVQHDERIRVLAAHAVGRGCARAGIAIAMLTFILADAPVLALKTAALLAALVWAVLLLQSARAQRTPYHETQLWELLDGRHGCRSEEQAQHLIAGILSETFIRYAVFAGIGALLLLLLCGVAWIID